jgi:hypothetical protein
VPRVDRDDDGARYAGGSDQRAEPKRADQPGVSMQRARLVRILDVTLTAALAGSAALQLWISPPASLIGALAVHTILVAGFTLPLLVRRSYESDLVQGDATNPA